MALGASRRATRLALAFAALLSSSLALGQITGDTVGSIRDDAGGALPGVTVEAGSPSFQGVRTAVTDSTGAFRLVRFSKAVGLFMVTLHEAPPAPVSSSAALRPDTAVTEPARAVNPPVGLRASSPR